MTKARTIAEFANDLNINNVDGYVLTADGAGDVAWEAKSPIDLLSSGASIRKSDGTTTVLSESGGAVTLENVTNAYLSGGVYLGGTGSANYLQDYETGTWTPAVTGEINFGFGAGTTGTTVSYTKIGRIFYTTFKIRCNTLTNGTQTFELTGWPFVPSSVSSIGLKFRPSNLRVALVPSGYEDLVLSMNNSSATAYFHAISLDSSPTDWSSSLKVNQIFNSGGYEAYFNVWYEVA